MKTTGLPYFSSGGKLSRIDVFIAALVRSLISSLYNNKGAKKAAKDVSEAHRLARAEVNPITALEFAREKLSNSKLSIPFYDFDPSSGSQYCSTVVTFCSDCPSGDALAQEICNHNLLFEVTSDNLPPKFRSFTVRSESKSGISYSVMYR